MITVTVAAAGAVASILHGELATELGSLLQGLRVTSAEVQVYLSDAATGADQADAVDVVEAHVLSSPVESDPDAIRAAAAAALLALDFDAIQTAVTAAATVADLKAVLNDVLLAVYNCAAAMGLNSTPPTP